MLFDSSIPVNFRNIVFIVIGWTVGHVHVLDNSMSIGSVNDETFLFIICLLWCEPIFSCAHPYEGTYYCSVSDVFYTLNNNMLALAHILVFINVICHTCRTPVRQLLPSGSCLSLRPKGTLRMWLPTSRPSPSAGTVAVLGVLLRLSRATQMDRDAGPSSLLDSFLIF